MVKVCKCLMGIDEFLWLILLGIIIVVAIIAILVWGFKKINSLRKH